jgi:uncharacterized protein YdaU (DUF1376 family)
MNYFSLHLGDYSKDTEHLSFAEHGAYFKLMRIYYTKEVPIPADQAIRLTGAKSRSEIAAVNSVLQEFFIKDGECWRHKRCDAEIKSAQESMNRAVIAGKKGAAKRWGTKRIPPPSSEDRVPIAPPLRSHKGSNGGWIAPNLQSPILDSEDLRSSAVGPPKGQPPPDPRKALWELGVSLLGAEGRSVIGQAIKRVGEPRVGEILGQMAAKPPAEPKSWFIKATQERGVVV